MENSKNWNYDEVTRKLAMNRIDWDKAAIPYLLKEARSRQDGDVIASLAECFEENGNTDRYLDLCAEAADLGSAKANLWLGHEYLSGENLPRDYEKAYSCFLKGQDVDWVPIDPEDDGDVIGEEIDADYLLAESKGDMEWWLFVLGKHPTRSLKYGLSDWYMKQGGDQNREKALNLLEESANEGFEFAFYKLIEFYSGGEFKDIEKGRYWFYKAEEHGFDEACFADALGVESLKCRELKKAADKGDCIAAAKLAYAYLHGGYDGGDDEYVCCAKDEEKARHYGVLACMDDRAGQILVNLLDDDNREDQRFLNEVAREAGLECPPFSPIEPCTRP